VKQTGASALGRPFEDAHARHGRVDLVSEFWRDLETAGHGGGIGVASMAMHKDVEWNRSDPMGRLHGVEAFASDFWQPLLHSFPDMTRQTHVVFGGESNGRLNVSSYNLTVEGSTPSWRNTPT